MVKGFIVILVIIGKRTISVLDIITHLYYIVKYYFIFFGGAMIEIGDLVKARTIEKDLIGIVIDTGIHHNGDWKYLISFAHSGYEGWWTEDRLEVICK